jgi:hypothetical protein
MILANIDINTVNLRFYPNYHGFGDECSYKLGEGLFNFLSLDIKEVYYLYIELSEVFFDYIFTEKNERTYKTKITEIKANLDKHSVYLRLFTNKLLYLMASYDEWGQVFEEYLVELSKFFPEMAYGFEVIFEDKSIAPYFDVDLLEKYEYDYSKTDYDDDVLYIEKFVRPFRGTAKQKQAHKKRVLAFIAVFIAETLKQTKNLFLSDIDAIMSDDKKFKGLSLSQKLYLLDERRAELDETPIYRNVKLWQTSFQPFPAIGQNLYGEKVLRNAMLKDNIEIKLAHEIYSLSNLIIFELLTLLETDDLLIKKCKFCGSYFVPQGRSDTIFCDRIAKGETKPCRVIGSLKLHKETKDNNPIHAAHQKAYRRMNSKCRTGRITQTEFFTWSEEARAKRDLCLKGGLDFKAFSAWLESDKADKKKTK